MTESQSIIRSEGGGEVYGKIATDENGTKVYTTYRMPSHYVHKYCGYGISLSVFEELKRREVDEIHTKTVWDVLISSVDHWDRKGTIDVINPKGSGGYSEEHIFLSDGMQERTVKKK